MAKKIPWNVVALVAVLLLLLGFCLHLTGASLGLVAQAVTRGCFGSSDRITLLLEKTTPYLFAGLAVFFALKAGLFNIGVEGQLVLGALACAAVETKVPGYAGAILGMVAGVAVGAIWAFPPGWIRAYRGGHEVITTIMLNSVAGFLSVWLVRGVLKAPHQESPTTAHVLKAFPQLTFGQLHVNVTIVIAIVGCGIMAWWFKRTSAGFELMATGANAKAAAVAGVDYRKKILLAMVVSGAIGGFAGVVQVMAFEGRFYPDISSGIGFDSLGVALLAGSSAYGVIPASLLFGVLAASSVNLAIDGVPKGMTGIVLGALIIALGAIRFRQLAREV